MYTLKLSTGKHVAFYLPENWWQKRGDVCLYGQFCDVLFVEREAPGYTPIPVYYSPTERPTPTNAELTAGEAEEIVQRLNGETLGITEDGMWEIVDSSMAAQRAQEREVRHA